MQLTGRTPTDHIAVFEGNPRLAGRTVQVAVEEATAFTLFGTVVTGEQMGVASGVASAPRVPASRERERPEETGRLNLPLV